MASTEQVGTPEAADHKIMIDTLYERMVDLGFGGTVSRHSLARALELAGYRLVDTDAWVNVEVRYDHVMVPPEVTAGALRMMINHLPANAVQCGWSLANWMVLSFKTEVARPGADVYVEEPF